MKVMHAMALAHADMLHIEVYMCILHVMSCLLHVSMSHVDPYLIGSYTPMAHVHVIMPHDHIDVRMSNLVTLSTRVAKKIAQAR